MACLYRCALWISLIQMSMYSNEAILRSGPHLVRRTRAAQRMSNENVGIVFPGLSSRSGVSFKPTEIPKDCEIVGICDKVPDYPKKYVAQLLTKMPKANFTKFNVDELDTQIAQRIGPVEENLPLCKSREELINPLVAMDVHKNYYYILNSVPNVQQTYRVEICDGLKNSCNSVVYFSNGYNGFCEQKFILRKMVALDYNGDIIEKAFRIPSCCSCSYRVARDD